MSVLDGAKISIIGSLNGMNDAIPKMLEAVRKKLGEQASCLFLECTGKMPVLPVKVTPFDKNMLILAPFMSAPMCSVNVP